MNLTLSVSLSRLCCWLLAGCSLGLSGYQLPRHPSLQPNALVWHLSDPARVGGLPSDVLGHPQPAGGGTAQGIFFNGVGDGIIVPLNPVANWPRFTVEVRFKPAADGPTAPRFVHFEDSSGKRGTLELRVTKDGNWYADTFLKNGRTDKGLTLIDSTKLHPCGTWYWLAMTYDGRRMRDYVNGVPELEGGVQIDPMTVGRISLGMRLNQVNWYKGEISEIRFHPSALSPADLQKK